MGIMDIIVSVLDISWSLLDIVGLSWIYSGSVMVIVGLLWV